MPLVVTENSKKNYRPEAEIQTREFENEEKFNSFNFKPRMAGFTRALKIQKQTIQLSLKLVSAKNFFDSAVPLFHRPHQTKFSFHHITFETDRQTNRQTELYFTWHST